MSYALMLLVIGILKEIIKKDKENKYYCKLVIVIYPSFLKSEKKKVVFFLFVQVLMMPFGTSCKDSLIIRGNTRKISLLYEKGVIPHFL